MKTRKEVGMWDFLLVLGIVPGTNFQITFAEIVAALLLAATIVFIYKRSLTFRRQYKQFIKFAKKEIRLYRRIIKRQHRRGLKYLAAFKRKLKTKTKPQIKTLRGISAGKLHARQRTA